MQNYIAGDYDNVTDGFETLILSDMVEAAKEDRVRRAEIETTTKLLNASFEAFINFRNDYSVENLDVAMVSIESSAALNLGEEGASKFKYDTKKFNFKDFIKKVIEWLKKLVKDSYAYLMRVVHDCLTRLNLSFQTRAQFIEILEKYLGAGGKQVIDIEAKFGEELVNILRTSESDIDCVDIAKQAAFFELNFNVLANFNVNKYVTAIDSVLDVALKNHTTPTDLLQEVTNILNVPIRARKLDDVLEPLHRDIMGPIGDLINAGLVSVVEDDTLYSGRKVISSVNFGVSNRIVFIPPERYNTNSTLSYLAGSSMAIRRGFAHEARVKQRSGEVVKTSVNIVDLLKQLKAVQSLATKARASIAKRGASALDRIFVSNNTFLDKFNKYAALLDQEGVNEKVVESCKDLLLIMNVFKNVEETFGPRLVTVAAQFITASDAVAKTLYTAVLYANKVGTEGRDEFPFPSLPNYFFAEPKLSLEGFDNFIEERYKKSVSLIQKELKEAEASTESIALVEKILG